MIFIVRVFSGEAQVDEKWFIDEDKAEVWAGEQQDAGFKVRFV